MFNFNTILVFVTIFALSNAYAVCKTSFPKNVFKSINIVFLCNNFHVILSAKKLNKKCGVDDGPCQAVLYGGILKEVIENGIPEYDIPKIDPYEVKDLTTTFLGMVNVTMVDGVIAGFKTCKTNSFK